MVLLIASVVIVGDLIVTVFTFLQGEISTRFFLKALVIFLITGIVFGFYFLERRKIQYRKPISQVVFKLFGLGVALLIVFSIILGFFAGGSPATERKRGFDDQRENDLSSIASCVENYAREFKRLPASLEELEKTSYSYCASKKDPETGMAYSYQVITSSKTVGTNKEGEFELCANFSLKSEEDAGSNGRYNGYYNSMEKWNVHNAGIDCDSVTVVLENLKSPSIPTNGQLQY